MIFCVAWARKALIATGELVMAASVDAATAIIMMQPAQVIPAAEICIPSSVLGNYCSSRTRGNSSGARYINMCTVDCRL